MGKNEGLDRQTAYVRMREFADLEAREFVKTPIRILVRDFYRGFGYSYHRPYPTVWAQASTVARKVDISEQEWEPERAFGDLRHHLFMYGLKTSLDRSIDMRLSGSAENEYLKNQIDQVAERLDGELTTHGLLGRNGKCSAEELFHISAAIGETIAEEWGARGGAELPESIELLILSLCNNLEDFLDFESTYGHDTSGRPVRTYPGDFTIESAEHILGALLPISVKERVSFRALGWESLNVSDVIARSVSRAIPEILTRRVDRQRQQEREAILAESSVSLNEWQRAHHRPLVSPYGLNPDEAEEWVCKWMLHMGASGAVTTQYVGDGGVDVVSEHYIAQVKMYAGTVGIASLREFVGVAFLDEANRKPLFFTTGKYPTAAPALADSAGMALFHFELSSGKVTGVNELGAQYVEFGFLSAL